MNKIAFPGLGLKFNIDPVAFTIGGKNIYWYGIVLGVAFIVGFIVALRLATYNHIEKDRILDLVILLVPFSVIGARIYYVIFNLQEYIKNPSEVYRIWHGGLAIYGGILVSIVVVMLYSARHELNFMSVGDTVIPGLLIGQVIGRWGNFINAEAYGYKTSLPWRMEVVDKFTGSVIAVHPTFMYESLLNLMLFVAILFFYKRRKYDGQILVLYMIFYGAIRFFVEGLRSDSLYIMSSRISQIVSIIFVVLGIYTHIVLKRRKSRLVNH